MARVDAQCRNKPARPMPDLPTKGPFQRRDGASMGHHALILNPLVAGLCERDDRHRKDSTQRVEAKVQSGIDVSAYIGVWNHENSGEFDDLVDRSQPHRGKGRIDQGRRRSPRVWKMTRQQVMQDPGGHAESKGMHELIVFQNQHAFVVDDRNQMQVVED